MTTPKVKTIFDDQKLKLTAKPIEAGARPPTFQLSTYMNNPQFTVYTNHDNGSGVTWISAGMDVTTFGTAIQILQHLADPNTAPDTYCIENKRDIPKDKRTDPKVTKQVVSKTMIGKDDDGKIWISVQDQNKPNAPKIRFYFMPNYYHNITSKNGLAPADLSRLTVRAWTAQMSDFMVQLLMNNPNAKIDQENNMAKFGGGKSYGGGGNKSYGNNGGGNKSYGGGQKSYGNNNGGGNGGGQSADGFGGDEFSDDWDG